MNDMVIAGIALVVIAVMIFGVGTTWRVATGRAKRIAEKNSDQA